MKGTYFLRELYLSNQLKIDKVRIKIEERVRKKLIKRYDHPLSYYNIKLIDDILYNERTRFVEAFKEILLYDDPNEFLKNYYNKIDIIRKLPKILSFYEKYSKIYANYTVISGRKYMYKNIKRKQKLIDQMQEKYNNDSNEEDNVQKEILTSKIFTTNAMDSINSFTYSLYFNTSNNKTKTDSDAADLVVKINNFEKQAEMIKNKIKYQNNSRNYKSERKKKQIFSHTKALSNNIMNSLINNNTKSNINDKNLSTLKKHSNKISVSIKSEPTILSNNTSPKNLSKHILKTPSKKNLSQKKISYISPSLSINNSRKNSIITKLVSNSKNKKQIESEKNSYRSKIFSYKSKKRALNLFSIKKSSKNLNNNFNTVNNQEILTQNISHNNELLKTLHNNSIFNNHVNYNTNSNNNSSTKKFNKNYNNPKSISKNNSSTKYNLNLRKVILNNFETKSSSTEKNIGKNNYKFGKFYPKNSQSKNNNSNTTNSNIGISKFSSKEKNNNILTKNKISVAKNNKKKKILSPFNTSNNNNVRKSIQVNLGDKFKITGIQTGNIIKKKNEDSITHSEHLKKTKKIFK